MRLGAQATPSRCPWVSTTWAGIRPARGSSCYRVRSGGNSAACAIKSLGSGHYLGKSVARLPLMPTDFKRDPARLAELRVVVDQLTDIDLEEGRVELLQSIRLLLGVIAHC